MTSLARRTEPQEVPGLIDFSPDMPVLRDIEVPDAADGRSVSRFGDDSWDLAPAALKPTSRCRVYFGSTPPQFRDALKRLVYCATNFDASMDGVERPARFMRRLAVSSVKEHFNSGWRPLALWLEGQNIGSISEADAAVLSEYREYVELLSTSPHMRNRRIQSLWRMWQYAPYLPVADRLAQPPWGDSYAKANAGRRSEKGPELENRTLPIHPETMSALLVWSMRFVDEFSSDIIRAKRQRAEMEASVRVNNGKGDIERWMRYLDDLRHADGRLPGRTSGRGNRGIARRYLAAKLNVSTTTINYYRPDDIAIGNGAPLDIEIEGQLDGEPWVPEIDYHEVDTLVRNLTTACLVVIAYLSGLRPEECLALERGCCQQADPNDELSGYKIQGRVFKGQRDSDGNTVRGGVDRPNPWHVIEPVARAVKVMEQLHDHEILFPVAAFEPFHGRSQSLSATTSTTRNNIRRLIEWCNADADKAGRPAIPPDPKGSVTMSRFRRTVAWFIYRLPGGLIALGSQYGHINLLQSEGYGRRAVSGMSDVLEELAFSIRDRLEEAHEKLAAGEGVSGPAAERYLGAVTEYTAQFQGSVLTRQDAQALLRNPSLQVYDSPKQFLACCYDESQALCHPDRDRLPGMEQTPDVLGCDPKCANAVRTDSHMAALDTEVEQLEAQIASGMAPVPIQIRLGQRRERLLSVKAEHEEKRQVTALEAT